MTEHEKMAKEAMQAIFADAQCNALAYGIGIIKISYINGIVEFSTVDREEFRDVADQLIWLDNNARRETKQ